MPDIRYQKQKSDFPPKSRTVSDSSLDTLAYVGKVKPHPLTKRAKAKYLTGSYILDLVDLDSPLKASYWNTYHCASTLIYEPTENKITGEYCKNRWCLVCNRIRTAQLINQYKPELDKMKDPQLVTLTIPTVFQDQLVAAMDGMQKNFVRTVGKFKKRKTPLKGLRKLEVTLSKTNNRKFHPHYHVIIDGIEAAENLLKDWLLRYPDAVRKAQDIRACDEKSLLELFKYFTKILKKNSNGEYEINPKALDIINQATRRRHVFQPFGGIKAFSEEIEEIQADEVDTKYDGNVFKWEYEVSDWVSEYGELLTNNDYHETEKVVNILKDGGLDRPKALQERGIGISKDCGIGQKNESFHNEIDRKPDESSRFIREGQGIEPNRCFSDSSLSNDEGSRVQSRRISRGRQLSIEFT